MMAYEQYIKELKEPRGGADFPSLLEEIKDSLSKSKAPFLSKLSLAATCGLAAMVIGVVAYNIFFAGLNSTNYLADYVFSSATVNDNSIASYVFSK